jgi:hypothetical protein
MTRRDQMLAVIEDSRRRRAVRALTDLYQTHLSGREWT